MGTQGNIVNSRLHVISYFMVHFMLIVTMGGQDEGIVQGSHHELFGGGTGRG